MIKLGKLVAWNLMNKKVIDGTDPTLAFVKLHAPDQFEDLMKIQMPVFGGLATGNDPCRMKMDRKRIRGTGGLILR